MKQNCNSLTQDTYLHSFKENNIIVSRSPQYAMDWQLCLTTRILIFEDNPSGFSIDMVTQQSDECSCYIIPALHFHYISPSNKIPFWCVDIKEELLDQQSHVFLLLFKTLKQKAASFLDPVFFSYENLNHYTNENQSYSLLLQMIKHGLHNNTLITHPKQHHQEYLELCIKFLSVLYAQEGKLKYYTVNYIVQLLGCGERRLYRACDNVLGMNPKTILQQIIGLNCLFLLKRNNISFSAIAHEIGFSDAGSMSKFIKRNIGHTPRQIRNL